MAYYGLQKYLGPLDGTPIALAGSTRQALLPAGNRPISRRTVRLSRTDVATEEFGTSSMATQVDEIKHPPLQPQPFRLHDERVADQYHRAAPQGRTTILVADDETHIVDFLSIVLEDEGYRVLRAYDGQQAWDAINRERPSLVLSDVMMPLLGGVELVKRLRSTARFARMPVILMSAGLRQLPGLDVAFLPKPFDLDQVLRLVNVSTSS